MVSALGRATELARRAQATRVQMGITLWDATEQILEL